jgi:glycosyltransferase involved in cell wall biosynthesis
VKIACIATSRIPSRTANSIQVMKVCQALVALGHDVRLWVPRSGPSLDSDALAHHYGLRSAFPIHPLRVLPKARHYDFCLRSVMAARRSGADLHYVWPLQAAALATSFNIPTILEVHDLPAGRFGPALFRRFLQGRGRRRILPTTAMLRDSLERQYGVELRHPLAVLSPNGVDLERYRDLPPPQEARRRLGLEERLTAVYTGHLYAGRGIGLILELARLNPSMGFVLAGGEPVSIEHWRRQAQASGLSNFVLLGFVPNDELPLVQAAGDMLLMPHERRVLDSGGGDIAPFTNPMKVFEYLATGRPILASALPILREVLDEACAILVPPEDLEAWHQAVGSMARAPQERRDLGREALSRARRYTWIERERNALAGLDDSDGD